MIGGGEFADGDTRAQICLLCTARSCPSPCAGPEQDGGRCACPLPITEPESTGLDQQRRVPAFGGVRQTGRPPAPPGAHGAAQEQQRKSGWRRSGRHRDHGVTVGGLAIVGVGFPQSRELESFMQIPERERAEREPVFVRLDPVTVFEQEHQVSDVLLVEAIRHPQA